MDTFICGNKEEKSQEREKEENGQFIGRGMEDYE